MVFILLYFLSELHHNIFLVRLRLVSVISIIQ